MSIAGGAKRIPALPPQRRDTSISQPDRDPGAGGLWGRSRARSAIALAATACVLMPMVSPGHAQQLDMSHGGPIAITATDGMEWRQEQRQVIARGNATAVRQNVTVTADRLIAFYRPKAGSAPKPPQPAPGAINDPSDAGGNEIYRVEAVGKVHIFTPTDNAWGDRAVYDIDQSVLVLTGRNLKLTTPNDVLTARDDLEYWSQKHMAVARGDAVVLTNDGRRMSADTLVAYTTEGSTAPCRRDAGCGEASGGGRRRSDGCLRQAAEGGGVRARDDTHGDRHRDGGPRGVCA